MKKRKQTTTIQCGACRKFFVGDDFTPCAALFGVKVYLCAPCNRDVVNGAGTMHGDAVIREGIEHFVRLLVRLVRLDT